MLNPSVLYEINIDLATGRWGVDCPLDQSLVGPVQYAWDRYQKDPESLTFGGGLLAGSPLPGTRRMIFGGYSPQWEGFYVSALGGAMYVFHRVGANYVWLRGRCATESVLVIRLKDNEYSVRLEPVQPEAHWAGYTASSGRVWEGFYGLQRCVYEQYRGEFGGDAATCASSAGCISNWGWWGPNLATLLVPKGGWLFAVVPFTGPRWNSANYQATVWIN